MLIAQLKVGVAASKYGEIAKAIRDIVSSSHGLALTCVCLLKTRSIPKTTSGKIARSWCRRGFLEGSLQIVHRADAEIEGGALVSVKGDEGEEATLGASTGMVHYCIHGLCSDVGLIDAHCSSHDYRH